MERQRDCVFFFMGDVLLFSWLGVGESRSGGEKNWHFDF